MAEKNVVREDVVQIGFEVDDSLSGILGEVERLLGDVGGATGDLVGDLRRASDAARNAGEDLTRGAAEGARGADRMSDEAGRATKSLSQMAREAAALARTKFEAMTSSLKKVKDAALDKVLSGVTRLKAGFAGLQNVRLRGLDPGLDRGLDRATAGAKALLGRLKEVAGVGLEKLKNGLQSLGTKAVEASGKIAQGLGSLSLKAIQGLTAGILAASAAAGGLMAASVASGMEFQQTMANTSTMFGDVAVDTAGLNEQVLALSNSTGLAATEIGASLYNALSAGIPVTEDMTGAMHYMEASAKLAKAGFTDIDTAVTSTAKILNAYKMDVDQVDSIHKILIQTQNKGITTVGELGASLAQVTPTAAAMSVSFEQVGASLASMTAQGTPTAQATTQLNSLLAELGKQGTMASKLLEGKTGKSFKELMEDGYNLSEVLSLMQVNLSSDAKAISKLMSSADAATGKTMTFEDACGQLGLTSDDVSGELINMFGSLEAGKAALALAGENSAKFTENLSAMSTEADVVGASYTKATNTLKNQTEVLKQNVKNMGIVLFDSFDAPLRDIVNKATGWAQEMTEAVKRGGVDGMVASVGGIAAQMVGEAAKAAPKLVTAGVGALRALVAGIQNSAPEIADGAAVAVGTFITGVLTLLPEVVLMGADLVLSFGRSILAQLPQLLSAGARSLAAFAGGIASRVPELAGMAVQLIQMLAVGLIQNLPTILSAGINLSLTLLKGIAQLLPTLVQSGMQLVMSLAQGLMQSLPEILSAGLDLVLSLLQGMTQMLPNLVQGGIQLIVSLVQGLIQNLPMLVQSAASIMMALAVGLVQAIPQLIAAVPQLVGALIDAVMSTDWLKVGGDMVRGIGDGLWNGVKGLFDAGKQGGEALAEGFTAGMPDLSGAAKAAADSANDGLKPDSGALNGFGGAFCTAFSDGIYANAAVVTSAAAGISNDLTDTFAQVDLSGSGRNVVAGFAEGLSTQGRAPEPDMDTLKGFGGAYCTALSEGMIAGGPAVTKAATDISDEVLGVFHAIDLTESGKKAAVSFAEGLDMQATVPETYRDALKAFGGGYCTALSQGMTENAPAVTAAATGITRAVRSAFHSVDLRASGKNAMAGFISGLQSMQRDVMRAAQSIAQGVSTTVNRALDIHSPSRVMEASGQNTGRGLVKGLDNMLGEVERAAGRAASAVMAPFASTPEAARTTGTGAAGFTSGIGGTPSAPAVAPPATVGYHRVENNTYAPVFNLTVSGGDGTSERQVKRWIREAWAEVQEDMRRRSPQLQEV